MTNPHGSDGPPSFGSNPTGGFGSGPASNNSNAEVPKAPEAPQASEAPKAPEAPKSADAPEAPQPSQGSAYGTANPNEPQYGANQSQAYGNSQNYGGNYGQSYSQSSPQAQPVGGELPDSAYGPGSESYWNSSNDDRTMGLLVHILGVLTSVVGPAILYVIKKDESPFVRHHAAQSLNFQITVLLAHVAAGILTLVYIGGLLTPVIFIGSLVFEILALLKAKDGQGYKIPVAIPIFK